MLVGGGNSAGQAIVYLSTHAQHIDVLIRKPGFESTMSRYLIDRIASLPNVELVTHAEVRELDERLSAVLQLSGDRTAGDLHREAG